MNQITPGIFATACLALAGSLMLACKEQASQTPAPEPAATSLPEAGGQQGIDFQDTETRAVFGSYLELKDALVASDAAGAAEAAQRMQALMGTAGGDLAGTLSSLAASADLKEQRALFSALGKALEPILTARISSGTVYRQFCPMAFNNQGGYWFSDSETIRNPYFGDAMLSCGKVDLELKPL